MDLKDKVVLVTGSSKGIGAKTVLEFAKRGAKVVVTYRTNKKKADAVLKECKKLNDAILVKLDITNEDSMKKCVENVIDKFGAIDILVNNAGVLVWKKLLEQNNKDIDFQINTNLVGLVKMTRTVLPFIVENDEAAIVNVASAAGKNAYEGLSTYCASKFGIRGFTQALALELPKKIKIYAINPGMTATEMTNYKGVKPEKVAKIIVDTVEEKIKPDAKRDVDVFSMV